MCDTILASPSASANGAMLFGKNSDRQRNEAQAIEFIPAAAHAPGLLRCTYIAIDQAARTNAVLLCRPFWMWGAEMGANAHGLVIGNEAVHARGPAQQQEALLGDDLVRLALERTACAAEAVGLITALLGQFGQGGNNGHITPSYFNNAFMIADREEAFVLETVGREWVLERVEGIRAMSNRYSIGEKVAGSSPGLDSMLDAQGWGDPACPSYAERIANPDREHIGFAGARRACSTGLLNARSGALDIADMMAILRDHGDGTAPHPRWAEDALVRRTVCMHAGAIDSVGQTTGAMVSEIGERGAVNWVTGTSAPCTSIFKPVFLDAFPARSDLLPTDRFDEAALWWRHERIHRTAISGNIAGFLADMQGERDALETQFRVRATAALAAGQPERQAVVDQCWRDADALEAVWLSGIERWAPTGPSPQREGWEAMSALAGMSDTVAA